MKKNMSALLPKDGKNMKFESWETVILLGPNWNYLASEIKPLLKYLGGENIPSPCMDITHEPIRVENRVTYKCARCTSVQVILFEIDCGIFYANLHKLNKLGKFW